VTGNGPPPSSHNTSSAINQHRLVKHPGARIGARGWLCSRPRSAEVETREANLEAVARMVVERIRAGAAVDGGRGSAFCARRGLSLLDSGRPMSWSRTTAISLPLGLEINILAIDARGSTNIHITAESQNLNWVTLN